MTTLTGIATEQLEAFPRTTLEILEQLRGVHATALEKACDALNKLEDDEEIAKRYQKAEEKVAGCRELVRNIDRAIEELHGLESPTVAATKVPPVTVAEQLAEAIVDFADEENIGVKDVDPITGEVADRRTCGTCADSSACNLRMPGAHMGCGGHGWKGAAA